MNTLHESDTIQSVEDIYTDKDHDASILIWEDE